jgi:hypothetical protein
MSKQTDLINIPDAITVSGSNVGIGTSSPSVNLEVAGSSAQVFFNNTDATANGSHDFSVTALKSGVGFNNLNIGSYETRFKTGGSQAEAMRIDASGNVLVGATSGIGIGNGTNEGISISSSQKQIIVGTDSDVSLYLNRQTSDGPIAEFRKNGTTVGSIQCGDTGSSVWFTGPSNGCGAIGFYGSNHQVYPGRRDGTGQVVLTDNQVDFGSPSWRYDDVYATNGTIQTSDFNEKQDIASLTATEMLVGKRISALFKTFRWKDSVAENGDNARTHTGVIAQDVQAAFTAEGLDAGDYALFISSTWWETQTEVPAVEAVEAVEEVVDEDGNVTTEAVEAVEAKDAYTRTDTYETEAEAPEGATSKTRMGIRYPELLSFVAAYNEQRFASIEARLTALEA